ncbi:hypothetical protein [Stenotrophomonas maltophilia]|uniref:hypothetical protein n=1 Tax=Stenotrophomonas maltophilia TaxID=40324 RepID=UPI001269F742|nr:hypothetical protein [Stenotrophomonas maltophilia]
MNKHTPGPWWVDDHTNIRSEPGMVAFPCVKDGLPQEANARLIAAAPELLEALILLEREMVESGNAGSVDYGWKPAIEKTRAAIAKATGGAQ